MKAAAVAACLLLGVELAGWGSWDRYAPTEPGDMLGPLSKRLYLTR